MRITGEVIQYVQQHSTWVSPRKCLNCTSYTLTHTKKKKISSRGGETPLDPPLFAPPQAKFARYGPERVLPTSPPLATYNTLKNLVRDLLKIVIKDNTFRFHDKFFNQVKGVAMGTKCAPPFANLFLATLEEKALATWHGPHPLLWLRFLDDVLMLWSGDNDQLQTFLSHLNNQMSQIKFTMSSSQESTTFLDLEIYKGHRFRRSGILDTKLYIKPTNPQSFLHFQSCHSASTFSTIIKGELLRALRATSDAESYTIIVSKLLDRFLERGYPKELFLEVADTIAFGDRSSLLTPHPRRTLLPNVTIFSIRHHPALDSRAIWQILNDEETPFCPMITRPRPPSHRDLLVKAKTPGRQRTHRRTDPSQPSRSPSPSDTAALPTTPSLPT